MGVVRVWRLGTCVLLAISLHSVGCAGPGLSQERLRIGAPESAVPVLQEAPAIRSGRWWTSALRPEEREEELQILLFASSSPAFEAQIMPADRLSFVERWLTGVSCVRTDGRRDLAASMRRGESWLAIPLEVSVPVLLYRADLWEAHGLPEPASPSSLRAGLKELEERDASTRGAVGFTEPPETLLWSMAWSEEGEFRADLYGPEKVRAMESLLDWMEQGATRGYGGSEAAFVGGRLAALYTDPKHATRILRSYGGAAAGVKLGVRPMPAIAGARALNRGLVLVPSPGARAGVPWADWWSEETLAWVRAQGMIPAFAPAAPGMPVEDAVSATEIHPGRLPSELMLIASDALADAAAGVASTEEALRRAQARWQATRHD